MLENATGTHSNRGFLAKLLVWLPSAVVVFRGGGSGDKPVSANQTSAAPSVAMPFDSTDGNYNLGLLRSLHHGKRNTFTARSWREEASACEPGETQAKGGGKGGCPSWQGCSSEWGCTAKPEGSEATGL